jgi:hypothetical protein
MPAAVFYRKRAPRTNNNEAGCARITQHSGIEFIRDPIAPQESAFAGASLQLISRKVCRASRMSSRRPARSSSISAVYSPCLKAFWFPFCAPDPVAPPCIRHLCLPVTAGDRHGAPARVLAPHRRLSAIPAVERGWLPTRFLFICAAAAQFLSLALAQPENRATRRHRRFDPRSPAGEPAPLLFAGWALEGFQRSPDRPIGRSHAQP